MSSTISSLVTTTTTSPAASSTAARVTPQGGILEGANPSEYDSKNPIILFIIQVCAIELHLPARLSVSPTSRPSTINHQYPPSPAQSSDEDHHHHHHDHPNFLTSSLLLKNRTQKKKQETKTTIYIEANHVTVGWHYHRVLSPLALSPLQAPSAKSHCRGHWGER
jgi:hypothetical protein